MATVTPVVIQQSDRVLEIKWSNLGNGDTGGYQSCRGYEEFSFSFYGTIGAAGSVTLEQSPDNGTTAIDLKTSQSNIFSTMPIVSLPGAQVAIFPLGDVRPHVTAGDGTTTINVYLLATKK